MNKIQSSSILTIITITSTSGDQRARPEFHLILVSCVASLRAKRSSGDLRPQSYFQGRFHQVQSTIKTKYQGTILVVRRTGGIPFVFASFYKKKSGLSFLHFN